MIYFGDIMIYEEKKDKGVYYYNVTYDKEKLIEYDDSAEKIAFTGFSIKNADVFFTRIRKIYDFSLFQVIARSEATWQSIYLVFTFWIASASPRNDEFFLQRKKIRPHIYYFPLFYYTEHKSLFL